MTETAQITETEFLQFVTQPKTVGSKTRVIEVRNRRHDILLGEIKWYSPWRQYCFMPQSASLVLNHVCLHEIAEICRVRTMGQHEQARLLCEKGAKK